jgi:hypothetical protein
LTHFPKGAQLITVPQIKRDILVPLEDLSIWTLGKAAIGTLSRRTSTDGFDESNIDRVEDVSQLTVNEFMYIPIQERECEDRSILMITRGNIKPAFLHKWKEIINDSKTLNMFDEPSGETGFKESTPHAVISPLVELISDIRYSCSRNRFGRARNLFSDLQEIEDQFFNQFKKIFLSVRGRSIITGRGKDHHELIKQMIASAKDFVVISSAFINGDNLGDLIPLIKKANERGVRTILVWGKMGDSSDDDNIKQDFARFEMNISRDYDLDD